MKFLIEKSVNEVNLCEKKKIEDQNQYIEVISSQIQKIN